MIVEDQNMSDCFATYGDRPRPDREDFLRSSRCGIRQPVASNIHHSLSSFRTPTSQKISDFLRDAFVAGPAESNPNSRMMRAKTSGVRLMASSIIEKKSQGRENRAELRATDSKRRTGRKRSSRRWLNSSSRYFLKRSKIDTSQRRDVSCVIRLAQHNQMTGSRRPFSRTASLIWTRVARIAERMTL